MRWFSKQSKATIPYHDGFTIFLFLIVPHQKEFCDFLISLFLIYFELFVNLDMIDISFQDIAVTMETTTH